MIIDGRHIAYRAAHDNNLSYFICTGLEEDRIHLHNWIQPGGLGLNHLSPPHLQPLFGHIGVKSHVLGLEGCHSDAVLLEDAAQSSHDNTLPYVGAGTLNHKSLGQHILPNLYREQHGNRNHLFFVSRSTFYSNV
ncbi:MAG: hypothetical protein DDT18_01391 [Actinobacteria bacterium]|nr:hypothetical protein [Actinomycetota bacterium]